MKPERKEAQGKKDSWTRQSHLGKLIALSQQKSHVVRAPVCAARATTAWVTVPAGEGRPRRRARREPVRVHLHLFLSYLHPARLSDS